MFQDTPAPVIEDQKGSINIIAMMQSMFQNFLRSILELSYGTYNIL